MISHYHNKSTTKSRSVVYFILVANELINIVLILFQRVLYRRQMEHCITVFSIHLPSLTELLLEHFIFKQGTSHHSILSFI